MPGILGIVQPGMRPEVETRLVQNMLEPLIHFPWYRWAKEHWQGATLGIVSLGTLTPTPRCLISADERYLLAFEGELYNTAELQQELGLTGVQNNSAEAQAAVVLRAMRRWGAEALDRFNGLFQIAFWDTREQELILSCDRAGLRPIYFTQHKGRFAFAPEVKALLALPGVSREIDFQGVLSFLQHGFPLGEHTFFKEVKVLPGGHFIRLQRGRLQIQRYFKMHFTEKAQFDERKMQEQFVETWQDVMRRQTGDDLRLGSLLSGGLDSRLILAALVSQGKQVPTFTMGHPGSPEADLAKQAAEAAECPNLFSPVIPNDVATSLERAVYLTDGMFNCFHANVRHLLPSLTVNFVFDGICPLDSFYNAGEVHLRKLFGRAEPARWLHQVVSNIDLRAFRLGPRQRLNLLSNKLGGIFENFARHDFLNDFVRSAPQQPQEAASLLDLFRFEQRQQRLFGFGPFLLRTVAEVRCPYFDKKMLELISLMSPSHRSEDKPLHKYAIQKLAPRLAKIPWERTGLPLTSGPLRTYLHFGAKFVRRRAGALREFYLQKVPTTLSAKMMIDYDFMQRSSSALQHLVVSRLLSEEAESSRFFNRQSLQTLFEHQLQGKGNHADLIGRLLTVEMWHKLFVRDTSSRQSRGNPQPHERVLRLAA